MRKSKQSITKLSKKKKKAQYELDTQTANILALISEDVSKYEFLTGQDVLPEKDLQEKAAALKRF